MILQQLLLHHIALCAKTFPGSTLDFVWYNELSLKTKMRQKNSVSMSSVKPIDVWVWNDLHKRFELSDMNQHHLKAPPLPLSHMLSNCSFLIGMKALIFGWFYITFMFNSSSA